MPPEKLIRMANQIATFCQSNPDGARHTASVADHINSYWEPRMRSQLFAAYEAGETGGFHPLVLDAMTAIRRPKEPLEARTSIEGEGSAGLG
jgi:formate dehydrogenase subunit delta